MADDKPFEMDKQYRVAVNSYRGNGGGDLLTKGAGIPKAELAKRIVFSTDKDLRYYLMKRIEEVKVLNPAPLNQWRFIPENGLNQLQSVITNFCLETKITNKIRRKTENV